MPDGSSSAAPVIRPGPRPPKNLRTRPGALRTAVKVARVGVEVARSINILEMAITPLASTTSFLTSVAFIGHLLPPRAAPKARRPAHTIGTPDPAQFAAFTAVKEAKRPAINQLRESRLSGARHQVLFGPKVSRNRIHRRVKPARE